MIKLVDLEKKKQNYIYQVLNKHKKKINNYLDEELIGSSFALTFMLCIIRLGLQFYREERERHSKKKE